MVRLTVIAAPLVLALSGAALAAPQAASIDFGDDSSEWANDGECDDPRFVGDDESAVLIDEDFMKDATDCRAALEAGRVTLKAAAAGTPISSDGPMKLEVEFERVDETNNIYEFFDLEVRGDVFTFVTDYGPFNARRDSGVKVVLGGGEICSSYRYGTNTRASADDARVDETVCASAWQEGDGYAVELLLTTHASDASCTTVGYTEGDCYFSHIEATLKRDGETCTATGIVGAHKRIHGSDWQNATLTLDGACLLTIE